MAEFLIQDAAFTGFRVVRERPAAVLAWMAFAFVFSLVTTFGLMALAGPDLTAMQAMAAKGPQADPGQLMALAARLAPVYAVMTIVTFAFSAVLLAAMNRAVLRPSAARFGYLGLGADELRQFGLQLLAFIVFLGVYFALLVVGGVVVSLASTMAGNAASSLLGVAFAVSILAIVALGVRLSLASAMTFATGRISLLGSWSLTRGRFWPLLGTYVLTFALAVVVMVLGLLVILAATALLGGGNALQGVAAGGDPASSVPARLIRAVLMAALSALVWPLMLTPPALIYSRVAPAPAHLS